MHLSRPTIIAAARGILEEYGLGDLTIRRLAKNLGVAPAALYWHFPNKQALLAGVADALLAPLDELTKSVNPSLPAQSAQSPQSAQSAQSTQSAQPAETSPAADHDWWTETTTRCSVFYQCCMSCHDGAEVISAAMPTGLMEIDPQTSVKDALTSVGISEESAAEYAKVLIFFLLGLAVNEQARQTSAALPQPIDTSDPVTSTTPGADQPKEMSVEAKEASSASDSTLTTHSDSAPPAECDMTSKLGVRVIIDGIASQVLQNSRSE